MAVDDAPMISLSLLTKKLEYYKALNCVYEKLNKSTALGWHQYAAPSKELKTITPFITTAVVRELRKRRQELKDLGIDPDK